ncbi:MAG: hypothetical protein QM697_01895 [Lachnospiraceae bacterium]
MRQLARKLLRVMLGVAVAAGVTLCSGVTAKADTTSDAVSLYVQQLALLEQYQSALAAQYQAALAAQYQAALTVQAGMQKIQANAVDQAYLLNAVQAMQLAQYQAMIQNQGLEHQDYLLEEFKESQVQAMQAFLGYNGL